MNNKTFTAMVAAATIVVPAVAGSGPAHARDGVALGVLGGLAAGAIIGSAVASRPYYYAPAPVYVEPAPVYAEPPAYRCYWTRGEPVWDGYRGAWVRPRVQVCD